MDLRERFSFLLTNPDYATADLREVAPLRDGFTLVSIYALISSVTAMIDGMVSMGNVGLGLMVFVQSLIAVYVSWVAVAGVFHFVSVKWGGSGEFLNVLGGIGLARAPLILISLISFLTNIFEWTVLGNNPGRVLDFARLVLALIGSAWGWPGIICFYVLKNVELLAPTRALVLTAAGFLLLSLFEVYTFNAL